MLSAPELNLTADEKTSIQRLVNYIAANPTHRTSDIWGCFSKPKTSRTVNDNSNNQVELTFTPASVDALKTAKVKLVKYLAATCSNRCAYCKRPMGNYGWSWQIEHIQCKQHHRDRTFSLNNLTLACVDCNYRKASAVDKPDRHASIINPNAAGFNYSRYLKMTMLGTESLLLLKFTPVAAPGPDTYRLLGFKHLEFATTLRSINQPVDSIIMDIDRHLSREPQNSTEEELMALLHKVKMNILERKT